MFKNKFKITILLLVILLLAIVPISMADNEIDSNNIELTEENEANLIDVLDGETSEDIDASHDHSEDTFKKSDVYLAGDDITVDYIVDGNLFIIADNVTINSQIGGDAFICANKVTIEDQGYIYSNLFVASKDVEVKGIVYDVYGVAQNFTLLNGYIYRDLRIACENLNILGTVGRSVYTECANISFTSEQDGENITGVITNDLNYSSNNEISIPEGVVSGEVNFTKHIDTESNTFRETVQDILLSIGITLATVLIIWLLCLWIAPKFLDNTKNLISKKILPVAGIGLLTPIAAIIGSIILFILGITVSVGFITLGTFFILLAISSSIFAIAINNLVCSKLKIEKKIGIFGMLIASTVVIYLLELIPFIGGLIKFLAVIIGLGIIIYSIPVKFKKTTKTETDEDKKIEEVKEDK